MLNLAIVLLGAFIISSLLVVGPIANRLATWSVRRAVAATTLANSDKWRWDGFDKSLATNLYRATIAEVEKRQSWRRMQPAIAYIYGYSAMRKGEIDEAEWEALRAGVDRSAMEEMWSIRHKTMGSIALFIASAAVASTPFRLLGMNDEASKSWRVYKSFALKGPLPPSKGKSDGEGWAERLLAEQNDALVGCERWLGGARFAVGSVARRCLAHVGMTVLEDSFLVTRSVRKGVRYSGWVEEDFLVDAVEAEDDDAPEPEDDDTPKRTG